MRTNFDARARRNHICSALIAFLLLTANAFGQAAKPAVSGLTAIEREAAAQVKIATLQDVTRALSAPDMQGRGTMQAGGDRAARWIAERFAKLGLKPLGDNGTYLQSIKFKSTEILPTTSFKVGDANFKFGSDYVFAPPLTREQIDANGDVVFVGYGVVSPELKRNDLEGMDLKGKIVVLTFGKPKGVDEEAWRKATAPQNLIGNLMMRGAAAIVIANFVSKDQPFSRIADYLSRRQVELADSPELPFPLPPILLISNDAAEKIFAGTGSTFAQTLERASNGENVSRDLKKDAAIALRAKKEQGTSSNVVGYLEGRDPKLKDEAVVFSAHYDAYGLTADGKTFYPGAADNALGVAEMFGAAEAFTKMSPRPRRSIIFLAVTGEEYGLYGSDYWAKHPTWNIEKIAADVNYDGIGTETYGRIKEVVGFGAEHSDIGKVLESVAPALEIKVVPDPMPEEKVFYRSDHYSFVKKGVPALMILGAPDISKDELISRIKKFEASDYHQPTDTIKSDWNWEGVHDVTVLGMIVGERVANAEQMPQWNASSPFNRKRGTNEPAPSER
jgi:hypothetical protein